MNLPKQKAIPEYKRILAYAQKNHLPFFTVHDQMAARLLYQREQERKHYFLNLLKWAV